MFRIYKWWIEGMSHKPDIKPDDKLRLKNYLYFRRSNWLIVNATGATAERYLIELANLANPSKSLADIFLYFFPSIHECHPNDPHPNQLTLDFNRLFRFMVELYHLHEKYLGINTKKTQQRRRALHDIVDDKYEILVDEKQMDEKQMEEKKKEKQIMEDRIIKLYDQSGEAVKKELEKIAHLTNDFLKVRTVKQKLIEKYESSVLAIEKQEIKSLYFPDPLLAQIAPLYIRRLLNTLADLQFTRKYFRGYAMKEFLKNYSAYFQASQLKDAREGPVTKFIIKRYTSVKNTGGSNQDEVLLNLNNMVDLRRKEVSYSDIDLNLIKQLGKELRQHKKLTKNQYPLLHPKFVIFNQLSLKLALSFHAPLLAALGLLKTPATHEQAVAFAATPRLFDQFSAPNEHLSFLGEDMGSGEQIFYDLMYGMDSLAQIYDKRAKEDIFVKRRSGPSMREVKAEREKVSEAWRYVMIASYLLNGREYYKPIVDPLFDFPRFKKFLAQEHQKCRKNGVKKYVESVIGPVFCSHLAQSKLKLEESEQLSLTVFDSFLEVNQQVSEVSAETSFSKINQLIRSRRRLKNEIIDAITKEKQFKLLNITRYFAAFYILLFEAALFLTLACSFYAQSFTKGREMLSKLGQKIGLGEFETEEDEGVAEKAYSRLKQYERKYENKASEQIKYLIRTYEAAYKNTDANRITFLELKRRFKAMAFSSGQEEQPEEALGQIMAGSMELMNRLQRVSIDIIDREFATSKEALKGVEEWRAILIHRTHLKLLYFLTLTHDNYATLSSLVAPILAPNLDKEDKDTTLLAEYIPLCEYAREILREQT